MPEGPEACHALAQLAAVLTVVFLGSEHFISAVATHWRWPATLSSGGSQRRRACVCGPGCRGCRAHDRDCPQGDGWHTIETADRRPLQEGRTCAHSMQFVSGSMPKSVGVCTGAWRVVPPLVPSNKAIFMLLENVESKARRWYCWHLAFAGEVFAAASAGEFTGYGGPEDDRRMPGPVSYTAWEHPFAQNTLHLSNGTTLVLFDQANMAALTCISWPEMAYRIPHVLNGDEWHKVVQSGFEERVKMIDGEEVTVATLTVPVYDTLAKKGKWTTYRNLQWYPVILFMLKALSQVFGKYHAVEALFAAEIPPFAPATVLFKGTKWRLIVEYLRLHHLLAASSVADYAEVQATIIAQLNHVYNAVGSRAIMPGTQPKWANCPQPSRWHAVGKEILWLPAIGELGKLGSLYSQEMYGPVVVPSNIGHEGGAFAGFRSHIFRPFTVVEDTVLLQPAPEPEHIAKRRLASAAEDVVDLDTLRSFMDSTVAHLPKKQRLALQVSNPMGAPRIDRVTNGPGTKGGRPPKSRSSNSWRRRR